MKKCQIFNECHHRSDNTKCLILSKVIIGLVLCQKNQRLGVLKIYWRVMGCQICRKVWKFARFCKNHNFHVPVSQKISILKGWFTIICKVCMVLFTETYYWVFIFNYLWFHRVLKMGWTSKSQKLWVENPFLESYIFWRMLWSTYILHKSENMGRNSARNLKIK